MSFQEIAIAVVDDDAELREALGSLLSAFGYRAELFASAEEFLATAKTIKARCLVIDIQLGGMSGVEMARELTASGFKFPVIFMTGSQSDTFRQQAIDVGCVAYLHKPFPAVRLIEAIKAAATSREFQ
jgi:FixJ family two-component response regulator